MSDGIGYYAFRPLRHFADFGGRSRRTEVVIWYLAVSVAGVATHLAASAVMDDTLPATLIFDLLILCPTLALCVRRLHDGGLSGWWSLLALPLVADGLYQSWTLMTTDAMFAEPPLPGIAAALAAWLAFLALVVLLFKPDTPGPNRWGNNPRYDAPEPA